MSTGRAVIGSGLQGRLGCAPVSSNHDRPREHHLGEGAAGLAAGRQIARRAVLCWLCVGGPTRTSEWSSMHGGQRVDSVEVSEVDRSAAGVTGLFFCSRDRTLPRPSRRDTLQPLIISIYFILESGPLGCVGLFTGMEIFRSIILRITKTI